MRTVVAYHRGGAYADGRVFSGTLDGRLLALDARTGKLLWSVETVEPDSFHTITGAPRVFNGKVIIGNGGADYGARGNVTVCDQKTGKQLWQFYTVPGSPEQNKGNRALEFPVAGKRCSRTQNLGQLARKRHSLNETCGPVAR